jgi:cobalt/nickel transport system permease protein
MMRTQLPSFVLNDTRPEPHVPAKCGASLAVINKGIERFGEVMKTGFMQYELASRKGLLQDLDARLKVFFLLLFAIIISFKATILSQALIGIFLLLLAASSRLHLWRHYRKILLLAFVFGFLMAIPSALNIVSSGEVVFPLFQLSSPYDFWHYQIPQVVGFTGEGLLAVSLLTLRVMNSLAVSFLVISTTPFLEFVKALKIVRVPDAFLMTIALSYKYIFIFAQTIHDMHLAKKSRLVGRELQTDTRRWMAGRMAFMFRKSQYRCEEIFKAMQQRGFSGAISLCGSRSITKKDWLTGSMLLGAGVFLLLF